MISRENRMDRIRYFRRIILLSVAVLVMMTRGFAAEDLSGELILAEEHEEDVGQTDLSPDAWMPEAGFSDDVSAEDLSPEEMVSDNMVSDIVSDETADASMMQEIFPEEELLIGEEIFEEEDDTEPFTFDETHEQVFPEEFEEESATEQMPELMDPGNTLIITTYDRIKNNNTYTDIPAIQGCPLPYGTGDLKGRLNESESLGNIFADIYWEKYNEKTSDYERITSGKFPEGKCRCKLQLSMSESQGDAILYKKDGRWCARILFKGLPESLEWKGDGNANYNMVFESDPFYPEEPEDDFEINLKGNVPDKSTASASVHDEIITPNLVPVSGADLIEKGIKIEDAYWFKDSAETEDKENLPHLGTGAFFEAGTYYLAVRVSCSNPRYQLNRIWTTVRVNGYSISNWSKILPDGSLLVAEKYYEVSRLGTQNGIIYKVLDSGEKTAAAIGVDGAALPADVVVPAQVIFNEISYTVAELDCTFRNSDARTVQVPATVTTLKDNGWGEGVFYGCTKLESVTFADGCGVKELGDNCFGSCGTLKQVILPGSLKKISFNAFELCEKLEGISIPASVEEIDTYAFAYCKAMTQVTIPENSGLKKIGNVAFYDCENLTQIVLPASLETIGNRAFAKCTSLVKVSFPQGCAIKTIDTEAFGSETGSLPIQLIYVEGDTAAKAAIDGYITWAQSKGWTHVTSKAVAPPSLIGSATGSDLQTTCIVSDLQDQTVSAGDSKPALIVKSGDKTLTEGTDYDLAWSGLGKVGKASVTITGKGAYSGSITKTFRILPKGTRITGLTKGRKQASVKWKKQAKQTDGYEIQYSTKKDFSKSVKTKRISGRKKTSAVIKKLKAKKTYYVRIRTWKKVNGERYYSLWSRAKKIKIR